VVAVPFLVSFTLGHTAVLATDALAGVGVLVSSCYLLFAIVFTPEFWPPFDIGHELWLRQRYGARLAPLARAVNSALVFIGIVGMVGAFAGAYLELGYASRGCFNPNVHHHIDAIYVALTNFTTVGSGGFSPHSGACRLVVAGESVVGVAVVAVGIAVLAARLVVYRSQASIAPEDDKSPPPGPSL
jgi:hypothetical protein